MHDVAGDPAALERLREQRARLAGRLRPPWWYLTGVAVLYALVFAVPFTSRFLGLGIWPVFAAAAVVAGLLQWAWTRGTGIKLPIRDLLSPAAGRPTRIAVVVVSLGTIVAEHFLIERGLTGAAIVVAAFGVVAEVVLQEVLLRGIRQELRAGGGAA
jgi:hypothetical protein